MSPRHVAPLQALFNDESFGGETFINEPMARHTSYKIGGPARYYVRVHHIGELKRLLKACGDYDIPWTILGRGTNLLVADEGYDGVVIVLGDDFRSFKVDDERSLITAGAAVALSSVVQQAFRDSYAGLEFAVGTPGTLGGALFMNAGSASEAIGSRVSSVCVLGANGEVRRYRGSELIWGYRSSSFKKHEIILECELALEKGDSFYIRGKMEANLERRKRTQPLTLPSCGSVFRNPIDPTDSTRKLSAGRLIDESGLKGLSVGDAQISELHGNFIVNRGAARAEDVRALMDIITTRVATNFGVFLEPEVRMLGF